MMKNIIIFMISVFFLNGCYATYGTFNQPKLYSATRYDAMALYGSYEQLDNSPGSKTVAYIFIPFFAIDLPFSLVFDTILLPYKTYLIINEDKNATKDDKYS